MSWVVDKFVKSVFFFDIFASETSSATTFRRSSAARMIRRAAIQPIPAPKIDQTKGGPPAVGAAYAGAAQGFVQVLIFASRP